MALSQEVKDLFQRVRVQLGYPVRPVQIDDNQFCSLLEVAIGDYAQYVQNWVVESQWMTLYGKSQFMNSQDLAFALTTRTMDYARDYSEYFSKDVGLNQRGTKWELKKDFFEIEMGKQSYIIPAGRSIEKVLHITPSTTKAALYGINGSVGMSIGAPNAQLGGLGGAWGVTGFYVGSAYDVALLAADLKYKNSLVRGDLAYKVTAGPNGTHIIHLLSVPGSPNSMRGLAFDDTSYGLWNNYKGCYCWYTYYDTLGATDEEIDDCRKQNPDVLITPDQVPLNKMGYELMNEPTKQIVRQLLFSEACRVLGLVRGYASGKISISSAEMQLDYGMLMDLAKTERDRTLTELKERLERMLPWNLLANQATAIENTMKILQQQPLGLYVR